MGSVASLKGKMMSTFVLLIFNSVLTIVIYRFVDQYLDSKGL